ncbi:MAG: transposase [Candidatus Saccharimonadales bacterium]
MPSRNVVKIDSPNTFYHIYARGHNKGLIFRDDEDYRVFLNLLKRYLNTEIEKDSSGRKYANFHDQIELNCYCLMPNHFHLLVYQINEHAMSQLMRVVMVSYSRYFNKKYELSGALFETTYKASIISLDKYLTHISRYIHINPKDWRAYRYSSLMYYLVKTPPKWLQPERIIGLFSSANEYEIFIADYEDYKYMLDDIKYELANK